MSVGTNDIEVTPEILARADQIRAQNAAAAEATRSRTGGEILGDVGAALGQGFLGLGKAGYGVANLATLGGLDRLTGLSSHLNYANEYYQERKSAPLQAQAAQAAQDFQQKGVLSGIGSYLSNPALLADVGVQALPSLLPVGLAGRAAKGITALGEGVEALTAAQQVGTRAAARIAGGQAAGMSNVDAINAIQQQGGSETEQQLGGLGAGVIAGLATPFISRATGSAALEAAAAARLFGAPAAQAGTAGIRGLAEAAAGGGVRQAAENYLQSGVQQAAQNLFTPNVGLTAGVGTQAALGGLTGLGLGIPSGVLAHRPIIQNTPLRAEVDAQLGNLKPSVLPSVDFVKPGSAADEAFKLTPPEAKAAVEALPFEPTGQLTPQELAAQGRLPLEAPPAEAGIPFGQRDLFGGAPTTEPVRADVVTAEPAPTADTRTLPLPFAEETTPLQAQVEAATRAPEAGVQPLSAAEANAQALEGTIKPGIPVEAAIAQATQGGTTEPVKPLSLQDITHQSLFTRGEDGKLYRNTDLAQGTGEPVPEKQAQQEAAAAAPTWQNFAKQELGLSDGALRAKSFKDFDQTASAAGIVPGTPEGEAFTRAYVAGKGESYDFTKNGFEKALFDRATKQAEVAPAPTAADRAAPTPESAPSGSETPQATPAEDTTGRYSRTGQAQPLETALAPDKFNELVDTANRLRNKGEGTVNAYDTVAQFNTANPGINAPADARGVYDNQGKLSLIRENIGNRDDLATTLAHERGHEGLAGLLGDKLAPITNRLMANSTLRKRVQEKMATGLDRATAGEEVLADMVQNGEKLTGDIMGKVRSALKAGTAKALGYSEYTVPDKEVDQLLKDAVNYSRTGAGTTTSGLADPIKNAAIDAVSNGDFSAAPVARFSTVSEDDKKRYDPVAAGLQKAVESIGTTPVQKSVQNTFKAGGEAAIGALSKIKDSIPTAFDSLIPRPQLVGKYRNLFRQEDGVNHMDKTNQAIDDFSNAAKQFSGREFTAPDGSTTTLGGINQRWTELKSKSPEQNKALNELLTYASYYGIDPETTPATSAHAPEIQALWQAAGPEGQKLFKDTQAGYAFTRDQIREATRGELARTSGLAEDSPEFQQKFGQTLDSVFEEPGRTGPYSPLQRNGDYFVTVRDADGNVREFSSFDTHDEARLAKEQMRQGWNGDDPNQAFTADISLRPNFERGLNSSDQATIESLRRSVADFPGVDPEVAKVAADMLVDAHLSNIASRSFAQYFQERKGTPGFNTDAQRQFASYVTRAGARVADAENAGNINRGFIAMNNAARAGGDNAVAMQQGVNSLQEQYAAFRGRDYNKLATAMTALGTVKYMTSPSRALVNAMQTPFQAAPRMAARFGVGDTSAHLLDAAKAYFNSRGDLSGPNSVVDPSSPLGKVMAEFHKTGTDDQTMAHELATVSNGGDPTSKWGTAMKWMSWFNHKSEVFNRQVTAHAYANMLLKSDPDLMSRIAAGDPAALDKASREVIRFNNEEAHFDPSTSAAPAIAKNAWVRLATQFQPFRLSSLALLANDIKSAELGKLMGNATDPETASFARKALLYTLGTQATLAGAAGTTLASALFGIVDAFRDDSDLTSSKSEFVNHVPSILSHGIVGQFVDTSRFDGSGLLPYFGDRDHAPKDAKPADLTQYYLNQYMGPWMGVAGDISTGVNYAIQGRPGRGAIEFLPSAIQGIAKTLYDQSEGGHFTDKGVQNVTPDLLQKVAQSVGIKTAGMRDIAEQQSAVYEATSRAMTMKDRYLSMLTLGRATNDDAMTERAYNKIAGFNAANPDLAIKGQDISRAFKTNALQQANIGAYNAPTARKIGPSIRAAMGSEQ